MVISNVDEDKRDVWVAHCKKSVCNNKNMINYSACKEINLITFEMILYPEVEIKYSIIFWSAPFLMPLLSATCSRLVHFIIKNSFVFIIK